MECSKCGEKKDKKLFSKERRACLECTKKRKAQWYKKNREKSLSRVKLWRQNNLERSKRNHKEWIKKNPEKAKERCKKWRFKNKSHLNESQLEWRKKNPERFKLLTQRHRARFKKETLSHYCEGQIKCACCGEKDIRFLCIDHVHNNGKEERKTLGSGRPFYRHLKKQGFPQNGYQVFCYNCNMGKRTNPFCPHKLPITEDPIWNKII